MTKKCFSCLPVAILNYYHGLANSYTLHCDRGVVITQAYWIIVALLWKRKKMKWFLQVHKFIRHSQNWDLSHNIIIIVLLECHHTKTIYCVSHFRWNIEREKIDFICCKTTNVFWPVFISIYVPIRMYFMCIAYYFVLMFMYILVFRFMFSSWLWILVLIAVFFVSNLMYCFLCFVRNDEINKLYIQSV